jgi:putative ABC transport system permease protein
MPAMQSLQSEIIGNVRPMLLTFAGAAFAVLLLVCANVAGLFVARSMSRTRELAVRSALGASSGRVVRQLLTESIALAALGGAVGTACAIAAVNLSRKLLADRIPRIDELTLDGRVLSIAISATAITALLCGLWPAIRASRRARHGHADLLRASAMGSAGLRSDARFRRALVTVQFALAVVLLIGAGLLIQSFRRAAAVDIGFAPQNLVSLRIRPPAGAYDKPEEAAALYTRLVDASRSVPGVVDAAFINHAPFGRASIYTTLAVDGRSNLDSSDQLLYRTVSESYLRTMRMSMAAGRWFDESDMRSPGGRFVINQTMAKQYWPGTDPIGRHITVRRASQARENFGEPLPGTVVGVVRDIRPTSKDALPEAEVYVPYTLEAWPWGMLMVRARDAEHAIPALARAVRAVDPRLVADGPSGEREFGMMESAVAASLQPRRTSMSLIGAFAGCALLLAAIGMYGVVAYSIARRTREIGVRKALGATDRSILNLMLKESLAVVGAGIVLGGVGATLAAGLIRALLFDTTMLDPMAYLVTMALLSAAALTATWLPARRALRLDPTIAIRDD